MNTSVDTLITQNEEIIKKVHVSVKGVTFSENMSEKTIELVKIHLGYLKNYADLLKTKLNYTRHEYLLERDQNKTAKGGKGTRG